MDDESLKSSTVLLCCSKVFRLPIPAWELLLLVPGVVFVVLTCLLLFWVFMVLELLYVPVSGDSMLLE